nr:MAG TPA: hypothetical protein [Caudoviricetes sp.]
MQIVEYICMPHRFSASAGDTVGYFLQPLIYTLRQV